MDMPVKGRILVVEDEAIVAMDITARITLLGHIVVGTSSSGEKAIEKARLLSPDLVLMDIGLKGSVDGIEAARYVTGNLNIPVIFLSANSDAITRERAMTVKPLEFIKKPFEPEVLITTIEKAMLAIKQGTNATEALHGVETAPNNEAAIARN